MAQDSGIGRRELLQAAAVTSLHPGDGLASGASGQNIEYPRRFSGSSLAMISFPLGGIAAGSIGLGGRGQFRDWEICNRSDKGNSPNYAFASIWIQAAGREPVAHVLEARLESPYEGADGLGSRNAPGLSRLEGATFTAEFPRAHIQFHDARLPVSVCLVAGTPIVPLDADESGLPYAVLEYRIRNLTKSTVTAAIAFSIENPVSNPKPSKPGDRAEDKRMNDLRERSGLTGLVMTNPAIEGTAELSGSFALAVANAGDGSVTSLKGWPAGGWWNSPLLFWDDFSSDGELGPEAQKMNAVGSLCLKRTIAPGEEASYRFLLAWHFPNRTPEQCGWDAPKGHEKDIIGNWYATRFKDAWEVAAYAASKHDQLRARSDQFLKAVRETTIPGAIKDAAMSNLSTLVSNTCFRTADGEFHGFEGVHDQGGCCFGNCTHVWNYETATLSLFPSLSQSLRRNAFDFSMDDRGALSFRQLLPDKMERWGIAAADGQMGQIVKVYLDWQQSGDRKFLEEFWPKAKRALEFAWVKGGWDANRDGVFEGVQHNTYDVEFYGPNPLCSVYYLAALRASEEMAQAVGDSASANEYRRLFESGSRWIDGNLFNGEYYTQRIEGKAAGGIASGLRAGMGADDPQHPQYQVGDGCLVDQLLGQYLADVGGLGPLLKPENINKTLHAIYRYNHKNSLYQHDNVQRTFALNDEAAIVICDYARSKRPHIPFPYYAEVMTGFEYAAACLMIYSGMVEQGVGCIADIRRRYDGVRRNPFDEAECGHHYARAMASWSGLLALSGFRYQGSLERLIINPPKLTTPLKSFWSTGTAWGLFTHEHGRVTISVYEGALQVSQVDCKVAAGELKQATLGALHIPLRAGRLGHSISVGRGKDLILEA